VSTCNYREGIRMRIDIHFLYPQDTGNYLGNIRKTVGKLYSIEQNTKRKQKPNDVKKTQALSGKCMFRSTLFAMLNYEEQFMH
jgi:hypothetical protein